ncbi:hypothetical protein KGM_210657 [Danaus plexippus plexippus]|uniref:Uncharacterized protein n=1 Tax=Danaus plexippus plexippus TaxID=278856 RepID=A0A212EPD3_DANPL|nr:hypothetical protein KGM_210657 [Danaus plexippus plexippus]
MTAGVATRRKTRSRKSWARIEQEQVWYKNIYFVRRLKCLYGDWPTLGAAVAGARCHSTPPPQEDSAHHNGNADQERKPLEEQPMKAEKVDPSANHHAHYDRHAFDKSKTAAGKGGNKSGKHKWVPLDIDVKAGRSKHGQHAPRQDHDTVSLNGEDSRGRGAPRGRGSVRGRGTRRGASTDTR